MSTFLFRRQLILQMNSWGTARNVIGADPRLPEPSCKPATQKLKRVPYGVLKTGSRHLERISVWDLIHSDSRKEAAKGQGEANAL